MLLHQKQSQNYFMGQFNTAYFCFNTLHHVYVRIKAMALVTLTQELVSATHRSLPPKQGID